MRIVVIGYMQGDSSQNGIRISQAFSLQGHAVLGVDFGDKNLVSKMLIFDPLITIVTMGRDFDHIVLIELPSRGMTLVNWIHPRFRMYPVQIQKLVLNPTT